MTGQQTLQTKWTKQSELEILMLKQTVGKLHEDHVMWTKAPQQGSKYAPVEIVLSTNVSKVNNDLST